MKPTTVTTPMLTVCLVLISAGRSFSGRRSVQLLVPLLLLLLAVPLFGLTFQTIDLPDEGANSGPFAINNRGQVVGNYFVSNQYPNVATLWQSGSLTQLDVLGNAGWFRECRPGN